MSSWLAKRTGIHINLRPLVRPAAAIAGGLIGGPGGAALASGLAGGLDDLGHGKNIGQAALGGVKTGAMTYAGAKLLPMLAHATGYGGGGDAAASAGGGGGAPGAAPPIGDVGQMGFDRSADVGGLSGGYSPSSGATLPQPGNLASRALSSVGGFVKQNPTAALNAAGTAASTYAQASGANADRRLYRDQVFRQNALEDEERKRRQSIGTAWLQTMQKNGSPFAVDLAKQLGYA